MKSNTGLIVGPWSTSFWAVLVLSKLKRSSFAHQLDTDNLALESQGHAKELPCFVCVILVYIPLTCAVHDATRDWRNSTALVMLVFIVTNQGPQCFRAKEDSSLLNK